MADREWLGGASITTQVDTFTLNNDFNDSETDITITMTAEDGSTQTVSIDPSGTDESAIAAALQSALDGSSQSLFTAVTWTVNSNVVTGTAVTSGVPFYASSAVTDGTGTITDSTDTANSGPNDWGTAANWSGGAVPVNSDVVFILKRETEYDILYGLDQSGVTLGRMTVSFGKMIGDRENGYALQINGTTLQVNATGQYVNIDGTFATALVNSTGRGTETFPALTLDGDIDNLYITGQAVKGPVKLANSMVLDNVYAADSPSLVLNLGSSISSIDLLELNSGTGEIDSNATTLNISGGSWVNRGSHGTVSVRGSGSLDWRDGNITTKGWQFGGSWFLTKIEASDITIAALQINGGNYVETGTGDSVTYTTDILHIGGSVTANSGVTLSV